MKSMFKPTNDKQVFLFIMPVHLNTSLVGMKETHCSLSSVFMYLNRSHRFTNWLVCSQQWHNWSVWWKISISLPSGQSFLWMLFWFPLWIILLQRQWERTHKTICFKWIPVETENLCFVIYHQEVGNKSLCGLIWIETY